MTTYTKEEIALILQAAKLLKEKGSSQKINISTLCREAGISRKNAYKHKKRITISLDSLEEKIQQLEKQNKQIQDKLKHSEVRAREADLNWELRNILVALNDDIKKNGEGWTAERQKLIDSYNNIGSLLGLEPLNFWD
jgi:hypothetical protein